MHVFVESFSRTRRITVYLIILLLISLGLFVTVGDTSEDHFVVEPIEVPKTMKDRGYTPAIVAQHMIADITYFRETIRNRR